MVAQGVRLDVIAHLMDSLMDRVMGNLRDMLAPTRG
jgi:hypothetical protein